MKGKHGQSAAVRREVNEAEAKEAAYRRQIVRITEERDQARRERDDARVEWRKEARILSARLSEAASPRTEALSRELERARGRCDQLERELRLTRGAA